MNPLRVSLLRPRPLNEAFVLKVKTGRRVGSYV